MLTATLSASVLDSSAAPVPLEKDALFVKNCCAVVQCHRRLINDLLRDQQLLTKAAKMYRSVAATPCLIQTLVILLLSYASFLEART